MRWIILVLLLLTGCQRGVELEFGGTLQKHAAILFNSHTQEEIQFIESPLVNCYAKSWAKGDVTVDCWARGTRIQTVIKCKSWWNPESIYLFVGLTNMYLTCK